jgi:flavorubredoxin
VKQTIVTMNLYQFILLWAAAPTTIAFCPQFGLQIQKAAFQLDMAKVGIFFGTSTGNTESVADLIKTEMGDDADGPFDIDTIKNVKDTFQSYDALIVGTPTWNTGADTERSGVSKVVKEIFEIEE